MFEHLMGKPYLTMDQEKEVYFMINLLRLHKVFLGTTKKCENKNLT